MPHKHREHTSGPDERPSERRHRVKKERDPDRPHKSRSSRPKVIDPVTGERIRSSHRRRKDKDPSEAKTSMADLVPELSRTASAPATSSRTGLPYPSFSKEHSKEAVSSNPRVNIYTPEPTDVDFGSGKPKSVVGADVAPKASSSQKNDRPPSPPETESSQQKRATPSRMEQLREESDGSSRPRSRNSHTSQSSHSSKERKEGKSSRLSSRSKTSKASTAVKTSKPKAAQNASVVVVVDDQTHVHGSETSPELDSGSTVDSNATSVAPPRANTASGRGPTKIEIATSPPSAQDPSPRAPTQTPQFPPSDIQPTPSPSTIHYDVPKPVAGNFHSPLPPPPPPPPSVPVNTPRVDYLMQNGGLSRPVPKSLLSVTPPAYQSGHTGMRTPASISVEIEKIFGPFYNILDQYETVIEKNGSLAVATGYRSVARRLLDRLEAVFARDLSSESCYCAMCQNSDDESQIGGKGLGWGEVLEWVSGRRELPQWPAFDFANMGKSTDQGLGISEHRGPARPGSPIKMDPDIAEEFREHYLRQSKKTKVAVDRWLSSCPTTPAAPPQEIDDETLSFSVLTHLEQPLRPFYNALLAGSSEPIQSASRVPAQQAGRPRAEFMIKTGQALQRLYRLPTLPRDPESGIYLLKNPQIHNLLATLSGINTSEWEILTSGRFDGFLWSGAESDLGSVPVSPAVSRIPTPANGGPPDGLRSPMSPSAFHQKQSMFSRITSPFSPNRNQTFSPPMNSPSVYISRNPTPVSFVNGSGGGRGAGPVSNDEDMEIAVLAEVERDIYLGMEALEDAFESLHRKAELVRRALRERGAGLSIASQSRRETQPEIIARAPSRGPGYERVYGGYVSDEGEESEWGGGDAESEIAPDDSASNISSNRHRRPKRRNERRTPAPVEEEDED